MLKTFWLQPAVAGLESGASGEVGSAIADLAIDGHTKFDLEGFWIDRFGRIDPFSSEWMKLSAEAHSKKN